MACFGESVAVGAPLIHRVGYHDEQNPTSAARPSDTAGLQLFCALAAPGAPAPTDPVSARFIGLVTRQRYAVEFEPADVAKTARYWARWYTTAGLVGPWSQPVSRTVAA